MKPNKGDAVKPLEYVRLIPLYKPSTDEWHVAYRQHISGTVQNRQAVEPSVVLPCKRRLKRSTIAAQLLGFPWLFCKKNLIM